MLVQLEMEVIHHGELDSDLDPTEAANDTGRTLRALESMRLLLVHIGSIDGSQASTFGDNPLMRPN